MSGLLEDVQKASGAMKAYGKMFEVKGKNIANVNDPNYAKQTVKIQSQGTYLTDMGPESYGVGVQEITDARNKLLDEEIMNEKMARGYLEGQKIFGGSLESHFNIEVESLGKSRDSIFSGGFSKTLNEFFTAFDGLSAQPGDPSLKTLVYNNGKTLVEGLNAYASKFQTIEDHIVDKAKDDVASVNQIIQKIAKINDQISRLEIGTTQKALEDRNLRQAALEELAQYINFTVETHPVTTGSIIIKTKDISTADVTLLTHDFAQNPLEFDGTNIRTVSGSPVTISATGGSLAGYMTFRDSTLADTKNQINALARQLVTSVNAAYNPTSSTGNFFDASGITAATIALDSALTNVNVKSTDTPNAGANELALAVAKIASTKYSTTSGDFIDGTYSGYFSKVVSEIGNDIKTINQSIENQNALDKSLANRRDSIMAVSLDEEVADLLMYQKGYAALAGYMKIMDELLDIITKQIS